MLSEALLIIGSFAWFFAIVVEYYQKFRLFDNQIPGPCITEREFTADNLLFVAFPVALVLVAEMNYLNSLGAIGLTCMLETFCIMGLTAYEKYVRMHAPFCLVAGVAHILVCTNVSIWAGMVAGAPLAVLGVCVLFCHAEFCPHEDENHPNTHTSVLFWMLDVWFIFSRLVLVSASPTNHVDHFWFDIVGALALAGVLAGLCKWYRN